MLLEGLSRICSPTKLDLLYLYGTSGDDWRFLTIISMIGILEEIDGDYSNLCCIVMRIDEYVLPLWTDLAGCCVGGAVTRWCVIFVHLLVHEKSQALSLRPTTGLVVFLGHRVWKASDYHCTVKYRAVNG